MNYVPPNSSYEYQQANARSRSTSGPGQVNRPGKLNIPQNNGNRQNYINVNPGPLSAGANQNYQNQIPGNANFHNQNPQRPRLNNLSGPCTSNNANYRNSMFVNFNNPEITDFSRHGQGQIGRPVCGAEAARMVKGSSDKLPTYNEATKK